jgi:hypothetical protein
VSATLASGGPASTAQCRPIQGVQRLETDVQVHPRRASPSASDGSELSEEQAVTSHPAHAQKPINEIVRSAIATSSPKDDAAGGKVKKIARARPYMASLGREMDCSARFMPKVAAMLSAA